MRRSNKGVSVRQTERGCDYWKFLKATTHQTIIKELVAMKADYVAGLCHMLQGQKAALKHTVKTAANGKQNSFCAYVKGNNDHMSRWQSSILAIQKWKTKLGLQTFYPSEKQKRMSIFFPHRSRIMLITLFIPDRHFIMKIFTYWYTQVR